MIEEFFAYPEQIRAAMKKLCAEFITLGGKISGAVVPRYSITPDGLVAGDAEAAVAIVALDKETGTAVLYTL